MLLIDSFIAQKTDTCDAAGGNKKCWLLGSYALLKGNFREEDLDRTIAISHSLKEEGVAIVPTVEYKVTEKTKYGAHGYILQRKAPGEELHKSKENADKYLSRIDELAKRPQEFYDKFANDWLKISEAGLMIDPSKSSNFFYTPEQIHFIDLAPSKRQSPKEISYFEASVVLLGGGLYYRYGQNNGSKKSFQDILNKTTNAFLKNGADSQKMQQLMAKQYPDICAKSTVGMSVQPPHREL